MNQIEKLILNETKGLPQYALNEVLDFIKFIKERVKKIGGEKNKRKGRTETERVFPFSAGVRGMEEGLS